MMTKRFLAVALINLGSYVLGPAHALAIDRKDVVGQWAIDMDKSKAAADGNTAGLMAAVTVKDDGTFEALYGIKGTWKVDGGKFLVSYDNDFEKDRPGSIDAGFFKFPAPAMAGRFCYLKKSGDAPATASAAPAAAPAAGKGGSALAVGSRVECDWKGGGKYYPGTVAKMSGKSVDINYDDGDKETTTVDKCTAR